MVLTRRQRPIPVERRAIAGRRTRSADKVSIKAIGRQLNPLAAEVNRLLRGGPIRFPGELY